MTNHDLKDGWMDGPTEPGFDWLGGQNKVEAIAMLEKFAREEIARLSFHGALGGSGQYNIDCLEMVEAAVYAIELLYRLHRAEHGQ